VKPLALDVFRENVIVISRDCRHLRPERLAGSRLVEVRANGRTLIATIMIGDDSAMIGPDEAGVTMPAFRRLGVEAGSLVDIVPMPPPRSTGAIAAKLQGETLSPALIQDVVREVAEHRWSDMEIAAFLVACASFMTPEEVLSLTDAMVKVGRRLSWPKDVVADKHCIGGIPGNRTSIIMVPILAAHGLIIPKTSSRAITSPAGTADTMEVIARVNLSEDEMRATVEQAGGCIVWGGRVSLSPADDVLISVERPLSLDTPEQMVASILSKKIAAGSTHLVIDIPVGPSAKVHDSRAALRLRKLFQYVGTRLGLSLEVLITDGSAPIGRGIGPVLEMRDCLKVLDNAPDAPADLREKSILLAGHLIDMDPSVTGGQGVARARALLESGAARAKLDQIAALQGPPPRAAVPGHLVAEIPAPADGPVASMDCLRLAHIARLAGAPTDQGAGIDLLVGVGDIVKRGQPLYRIHAVDKADFGYARDAAAQGPGVVVQ